MSLTPNQVAVGGAKFNGLQDREIRLAILFVLQQIGASGMTPNQIAKASAAFNGGDDRALLLQEVYLLTQVLANLTGSGGSPLPSGAIIQWSGTIATIPSGYHLCDGTNGTPDLRNKFVVCANADSGGVAKTTLTGAATQTGGNISHTHGASDSGHTHSLSALLTAISADLTPGIAVYTGQGGTFDNNTAIALTGTAPTTDSGNAVIAVASTSAPQPYFALAYIMKL